MHRTLPALAFCASISWWSFFCAGLRMNGSSGPDFGRSLSARSQKVGRSDCRELINARRLFSASNLDSTFGNSSSGNFNESLQVGITDLSQCVVLKFDLPRHQ